MRSRAARLFTVVFLLALLSLVPGGPGGAPAHAADGVGWGLLGPWVPPVVLPGGAVPPGGGVPPGGAVAPGGTPTPGGFNIPTWGKPPPAPVVRGGGAGGGESDVTCKAEPPGFHDPKAEITFTALLRAGGQRLVGHQFDYGSVKDLLINVGWQRVNTSARQRLALYSPDGHLFQMFTTPLDADPEPVDILLPVVGSWIMSGTMTGTWCAKVFLDDDLQPTAADAFELRRN